ncbi:hypothetical protein COCON_G00000410 [Conger conger]|uniref:LRAT domain-containing protein n=1 Tax=Conger conger TaxID=82655 RepID=A0A9Q1I692_CONCO|nr:hypothetical protein COCON_G00000410 [Conger conger]
MGLRSSQPQLYPGDIVEFPRNKHISHFGVYYGERDGVPYVAHLTSRDSEARLLLFGRALKSAVKVEPVDLPEIDEAVGKACTYDILFHNCEHQATLFRYGLKKSVQIEKIYGRIYPTWKDLFETKKL